MYPVGAFGFRKQRRLLMVYCYAKTLIVTPVHFEFTVAP